MSYLPHSISISKQGQPRHSISPLPADIISLCLDLLLSHAACNRAASHGCLHAVPAATALAVHLAGT